jgi:hypothetical protein
VKIINCSEVKMKVRGLKGQFVFEKSIIYSVIPAKLYSRMTGSA